MKQLLKGEENKSVFDKKVAEAREIAIEKKDNVDQYFHSKIDYYYHLYCYKLAKEICEVEARYITVPSWLNHGNESTLDEWQALRNGLDKSYFKDSDSVLKKLKGIGKCGISPYQPNAAELIQEKIDKLQSVIDWMNAANEYLKWNLNLDKFPLKNSAPKDIDLNQEYFRTCDIHKQINRYQKRLKGIEDREKICGWTFYNGKVIANHELNRLQIKFNDEPEEKIKKRIISKGFKWSRKNQVWQRLLTVNAVNDLLSIGYMNPFDIGE